MSISSRDDFESLVRLRIGYYPMNMNPAEFLNLLDTRHTNPVTYFGHYISTLKHLSNLLY